MIPLFRRTSFRRAIVVAAMTTVAIAGVVNSSVLAALIPESVQRHFRKGGNPNVATVIYVDHLDQRVPDTRAIVIRKPKGAPRNTILVSSQTRPDDLAKAVSQLQVSRVAHGEFVTKELRASITSGGARTTLSKNRQAASADLLRLNSAKRYDFTKAGFGNSRAITIRMKPTPTQGRGNTGT